MAIDWNCLILPDPSLDTESLMKNTFSLSDNLDSIYNADLCATELDPGLESFLNPLIVSPETPLDLFNAWETVSPTSLTIGSPTSDNLDQTTSSLSDDAFTRDYFNYPYLPPTPPLYEDGDYLATPAPCSLKQEPSSSEGSDSEASIPKPPKNKRGRPQLDRVAAAGSVSFQPSSRKRLPHNEVERKYREGLNHELERLRRAVPTLPRDQDSAAIGQARPSKAMILASAIDYIKKIEKERDLLATEVVNLKDGVLAGKCDKLGKA